MDKVAIIIINYKTYAKTEKCIELIREKTKVDYHIYLLDNGSGNESLIELKKYYENAKDVTLLMSEDNLGYAQGNNKLLRQVLKDKCLYAVIMNNDLFLVNNAIDIMVDDLQNNDDISFVGPNMVGVDGEIQLTAKNRKPNKWQYLCQETILGRFFKNNKNDWLNWQKKQNQKVNTYWLSGAIFATRMEDFAKIGFFDPFTFLYFEEYIIAEKANNAHLKLQYNPEAKVIHQHGGSTKPGVNLVTREENLKSEFYFLKNYWHWKKLFLIFILFIRIIETYVFWRKDSSCLKNLKNYILFGFNQLK